MSELVLEMRGITKHFPGVLANDDVNLTLARGEIHALLGENGAGKTTLVNILYGLYTPDEGEIRVKGQPTIIHSPADAIAQGIGMVHQHFMLIPVMTVTENIMLGAESSRAGVLDRREAAQRIRTLSRQFGLDVDPEAMVGDLSVGEEQRVEIVKALYRQVDILILDEPTAVLTPQEAEELFKIMHSLTAQGVSIIFITHKLREVFAVADRITVLRGGRVVGTTVPEKATRESLANLMVGREVLLSIKKEPAEAGAPVLRVENLYARDDRGALRVDDVSLTVRAGEILGLAGVQGNGQTELVEVLTGLRPAESGRFYLADKDVTYSGPRQLVSEGVAHIPEDRYEFGMVAGYPVADNLILNVYYQKPYAKGIRMNEAAIAEFARRLVEEFDIRTPSIYTPAQSLSGGNQQKMVVAREFSRPIRLLIANQPTRGLDVGSIEFIHQQIVQKRDGFVPILTSLDEEDARGDGHGPASSPDQERQPCAVLLVSVELDEILSLSDRIAVMYKGKITAEMPAAEATREKLGLLMAGFHLEEETETVPDRLPETA